MKNYQISQNVAQAVLDYLSSRPYKEVVNLVNALLVLKEVSDEQETKAE